MEFMNGALDPIGAILFCVICAIGLIVWSGKSSRPDQ
jgi:hypothetical protein